jgi:prepilin-type N-terminal cleavage/methylation domain-containing protein
MIKIHLQMNKIFQRQSRKALPRRQRGFTLLEMLVSLALFAIVMVIVAAAYLNLIGLDRQIRASNDAVNNLSFAIDDMARTIRTGTSYSCIPGDANGNGTCSQFSVYDSNGCKNVYSLSSGQVMDTISNPNNAATCTTAAQSNSITSSAMTVDTLTFHAVGIGTGDGAEPFVTMIVHGSVYVDAAHPSITFDIETSANERGIEL